jgi:hypothetical protein
LKAAQEIPSSAPSSPDSENKMWIMKAARSNGYGWKRTYRAWLQDGWVSFVDLIKVPTFPSCPSLLADRPSTPKH